MTAQNSEGCEEVLLFPFPRHRCADVGCVPVSLDQVCLKKKTYKISFCATLWQDEVTFSAWVLCNEFYPWHFFPSHILKWGGGVGGFDKCSAFKSICLHLCVLVRVKGRKESFCIFSPHFKLEETKVGLGWAVSFSRAWFSGTRQSVGLETLLFCDRDWKDKPRNMFRLEKESIYLFIIYMKKKIFFSPHESHQEWSRRWGDARKTMQCCKTNIRWLEDCWSRLLINKSQARLWVCPAVFR